jgi:transposase InsO family protein
MKYEFIAQHKKTWPVDLMSQLLGVQRNGYYAYCKRKKNHSDPERIELIDRLKQLSEASRHTYGSRRLRKALNALGYPVGRDKTRRLMKEAGIWVRYKKKYRVTTNSNHKKPLFNNELNRQFTVAAPNKAYVSDITYIWTQEGWLYVAVVLDLYSRKVVGWSMSSRMKADLVCDALKMPPWQRKPERGLIVHSDRGVQYASKPYVQLLAQHGCIGSMSRKGNCWDNAVAESFFGSLKQELVDWKNYQTRLEAQQDILGYIIMEYNNKRLHSFLGYVSPNQYEAQREMAWKK